MSATTPGRYFPSLRRLHWIIFALVLIAYVAVNLHELFPRGTAVRSNVLSTHFLAGIAVLLLTLPRLVLRIKHAAPPIVPTPGGISQAVSKMTHLALYLFLIAQPLMGIVTLQIAGRPIAIFGLTVMPALFGAGDRELADQWEDLHGTIGNVFYFVIGLHILAALWHHFVRKDNTLRRML